MAEMNCVWADACASSGIVQNLCCIRFVCGFGREVESDFRFCCVVVYPPFYLNPDLSLRCTCNRRTFAIEETGIRPRLKGGRQLKWVEACFWEGGRRLCKATRRFSKLTQGDAR